MACKIFAIFIILASIVFGLISILVHQELMYPFLLLKEFMQMALPILAFGALIKYLCPCPACSNSGCCPGCSKCSKGPSSKSNDNACNSSEKKSSCGN